MEIPTFDLELMVSGKAAKLLRLHLSDPATVEPVHFLAQWRVEVAVNGDGRKLFLVTNAVTAFSIFIPAEPKMRFEQLAEQFLMRLRFVLLGVNPPVEWKPGQVRAVRGGTRSLIGTMNNMVYLISARSDRRHAVTEQEDLLNDTPFLAIPEVFPRKAFYGRLGEVPPSRSYALLVPFENAETENPEIGLSEGMGHPAEDQGTPGREAQDLYYDAMEAPSDAEEFELLRRALECDPENVDALRAMLAHRRLSPTERLEELRKIVALAERQLGAAAFQQCKGAFWGHMETRPYMRARAELAECLQALGLSDQAIVEWQGMLELNPNDNQGIRYLLLPQLLAENRLDAASEILNKYNECAFSTVFAWCRVLERCLRRDQTGAERALGIARKQNRHSEAYIQGRKRLPETTCPAYSPGSKEEAICFAEILHNAWAKHPEALQWLST